MAPPKGGAFALPSPVRVHATIAFLIHLSVTHPVGSPPDSEAVTAVTALAGISVDVTFDQTYIQARGLYEGHP